MTDLYRIRVGGKKVPLHPGSIDPFIGVRDKPDADGMTDGSRSGSPHEASEYVPPPRVTGTSPEAETLISAERGALVPVDNAPGHTSDGYHTFDELYAHRCALTAVLATIGAINGDSWRSKQHHPDDSPMFDGFFVIGINLPDGQVSYHYPLADWGKFAAVSELEHAPKWDGHTSADVVDRLGGFVANLRQAIADGTAAAHEAHRAADAVVEQAERGQPVAPYGDTIYPADVVTVKLPDGDV